MTLDLASRIAREGPMSARDALAEMLQAYYARGPEIGARGDFYTSANVSLFPRALGRFVKDAVDRLDGARVIELGGGTGLTAASLGVPVTVVEPSPALAEAQRARGLDVVASLRDVAPAPTVFLANEVLDALPVHRLVATDEGLRELHVHARDGTLVEMPGPLTRRELAEAATRLAEWMEPGCIVEVNLDAAQLMADMARAAPRNFALFVDYGGAPQELYGPTRPQGSLRGYHKHRATRPYERPGEQDVTADVDFPFIVELAQREGYHAGGYRTQGEFLADLGLVEDMMGALGRGDMDAYMAAKNLLMPGGMGERFKALLLGRGVALEPPLAGFRPLSSGARPA